MSTDVVPSDPRSVLIVDDSADSRAVLRTVLEHRGMNILEAGGQHEAFQILQLYHPAVTVVDVESVGSLEAPVDDWSRASRQNESSLVVIGTSSASVSSIPSNQILPKPYHYGPLVRTIERLLEQSAKSA